MFPQPRSNQHRHFAIFPPYQPVFVEQQVDGGPPELPVQVRVDRHHHVGLLHLLGLDKPKQMWCYPILALIPIYDRLLREYYNQDFLLGVCPSRLFWTFNEANILLIVYFDNMFDLQSQKLQLESV